MRISKLTPSKRGQDRWILQLEDGSFLQVGKNQMADFALYDGRELTEEELEDLRRDCLVLDLASKPGGVDLEAAGELGLTVIWALSLPGKVAPVTAGAAIKTTIYNMLHELGR